MMRSSDSFSSSIGVPPYLRAHARRRYSKVGGDGQEQVAENGAKMFLLRLVGAIALCMAFAVAVSSSNSRWIASRVPNDTTQEEAGSYRGVFEAYEERYAGVPAGDEAGSGGGLSLVAENEYGEYDRKALALYGLDMLVEPFRETRITASHLGGESTGRFYWLLVRADSSGMPLEDAEAQVDARGGSFATVTLTEAGEKYALLVQQLRADETVVAEKQVTITCKYVRRELRDLTEADRTGFFSAMREFYTVPIEEGRAKYGEDFTSAKQVAAYHNSRDYCFHNGMHFLNAHAAFNLWVERNLQRIDPKVALAQWDFMLDAAHLGTSWPSSTVFGPDMFGSALGSPEKHFQISDGWFANITSAYDPESLLLRDWESISTNHNAYGLIDAAFNYQAFSGVLRTSSYCGVKSSTKFTQCDDFVGCFENTESLYDWATCMEHKVHASIHGMIGGGFDCNTDMTEFQEKHPQFGPGLLSFVLEFLLANKWPSNSLMGDYNECDEECVVGQTETCGCTCTTDPFDWTDDEVYEFMEDTISSLYDRAQGQHYIDEDDTLRHPFGFAQEGKRLDRDSTMLLLRQMMAIGCEPGKVGAMSTGAAPLDPIFWVLHSAFEKAQHILQLSPSYRDTYDFTWVDSGECDDDAQGSKLFDRYPFTEKMVGLGDSSKFLTNADILELLHPSNPKVPYLYDGFTKWGTCTNWDPCPECSQAVAGR